MQKGKNGDLLQRAAGAVPDTIKPKLRGWLHAGIAPIALAAGIVLVALAPDQRSRIACAVYLVGSLALFSTSAVYHRFNFSPRVDRVLKRIDHSNIYLMIAGTYTPIVVLGLTGTAERFLLWFAWIGAVLGILFRVFWVDAPRALYTVLYAVLGWSVIGFIGELFSRNGTAVGMLTLVGGLAYTLGALVYGLKRPDPWPRWFGFHEIFHSLTIVAWVCQYLAISLMLYRRS